MKKPKMSNITEATEKDWEDFWKSEKTDDKQEPPEYPTRSMFPSRY